MQSLFPTHASSGANASSNLLQFRAGKCHMSPLQNGKFQVTAEPRRGQVTLSRENDGLLHFKWSNLSTGAVEEDRIVMPGESIFKKVKTGRETGDRVFMLKFTSGNQRLMYWMQNKDSSKDEEIVKKANDALNNNSDSSSGQHSSIPVPSSGTRTNSVPTGLDGLDLSSLLAQFGQASRTTGAPAVNHTPAPIARPPTETPTTAAGITLEDLRRAMMGDTPASNPTPNIQDILSTEEVLQSGLFTDAEGKVVTQ